jgi:GR25 family glycosyltransferase involved in LPS biosynthesis
MQNRNKKQTHHVNIYFDKIFIINLKRRPDRLENIVNQCNKYEIKYEIFNAVDGYDETILEEYNEYLARPLSDSSKNKKLICSPGALGYLYTWKALLSHAIKYNIECFLSLDDDIIFHKDFHTKFEQAIATIPRNHWKIINLGVTQMEKYMPTITDDALYYQPQICDGSFATAVHYSVYSTLLSEIDSFIFPFDSGPLRTIYKKYPNNCYVIYPNIIIANLSESDIRSGKDIYEISHKISGWNLENFIIPVITTKNILIYLSNETIEIFLKKYNDIYLELTTIKNNCKLWNMKIIIYDDGLSIQYKTVLKRTLENSSLFTDTKITNLITNYDFIGINNVIKRIKELYMITQLDKLDDIIKLN